MSNKRWTSENKIELMKLYSSGKSYEEIATMLNRSPSAIKLRLESIVYENLVKGKPLSMLTRMLNTNSEMIKQLYYSHKSFKEGRKEPVENVVFPAERINVLNKPITPIPNIINAGNQNVGNQNIGNQNVNNRHSTITPSSNKVIGGSSILDNKPIKKIEKSLEQIENENHVLDEIIKNYRMKRQLRKLYVDGKLDEKSIELYEKLLKR